MVETIYVARQKQNGGDFTAPGKLGIAPSLPKLTADDMIELTKEICRDAAREMNLDRREVF